MTALTLPQTLGKFREAREPEDIFDGVTSLETLKDSFRDWAKLVHPDGRKGRSLVDATEAFKLLNEWHTKALAKFKAGTYGDRFAMAPVTLSTKKACYSLSRRIPGGDIANVYGATFDGNEYAIKVCRNPANNDLLLNEREILSYLWNEAETKDLKAMTHIVKYHDSFELATGPARKRVNVCQLARSYYTLAEVSAAYPDGIDMRDAAWMLNRVLGAILIIQQAGVVHNAILPEHVLIHPAKHNGKLCGWSYATKGSVKAPAFVARHSNLYATELLDKKPTSTATDLCMAVRTILTVVQRKTIPRNVSGLLDTCTKLSQRNRPQDAWAFFKELGKELEAAFGPKTFRPFVMPEPSHAKT